MEPEAEMSALKVRRPDYFECFSCLAGKCPDTCCIGWEVVVDDESLERYGKMSGRLADKIKDVLEETDGEYNFRLNDGRCPFLRDDLLCEMQSEAGEEALCRTCRRFPRYQADYGALREEGLSLSCPEAARLIKTAPRAAFAETDDPSLAVQPNDIDAGLYLTLTAARTALIERAQDRSMPMPERLAACLLFAARLQKTLRSGGNAEKLIAVWKKEGPSEADIAEIEATGSKRAQAGRALNRLLDAMDGMERLTDEWGDWLCKLRRDGAASEKTGGAEDEYENLFVYYLYRYFLEAVYDGNAYLRVKTAAVSVCLIERLHRAARAAGLEGQTVRIDLAHLYSREIEHSQENLDALAALLKDVNMGGARRLVPLLLS